MPAPGKECGEPSGAACGVQRHARPPAAEVLGHDRLVDSEQSAARFGVVAGGLLLVGGDSADALGDYRAALQLVVVQQAPDLGQPGVDERAVVFPGPG